MSLTSNLPDPRHSTFVRWAQLLCEELAAYNVPVPPSDDELWQVWGLQVYCIPEVVELGMCDPRSFPRWQDWAASFVQVAN